MTVPPSPTSGSPGRSGPCKGSNPSWHPSLASVSSSSSSSLASAAADQFQDASCEQEEQRRQRRPEEEARGLVRRVLQLLQRRKYSAVAAAAAWAAVSYYRRRRRRPPLLSSSTGAVAAAAATVAVAAAPYNPRTAVEAPLSLLLHHARKKDGSISRVLLNGHSVAYQIISTADQKTKWRRSRIPPTGGMASAVTAALTEGGCADIGTLPDTLGERLVPVLIGAVPFVYLGLAYRMIRKAQGGGEGIDTTHVGHDHDGDDGGGGGIGRVTFRDVAGVDDAKAELDEIVQYLSDPAPYHRLGATPPRGVLLHGPPGVGKTLLARAVAGEARADYFVTCSGSDFVELYVGQGAKRVRELFASVRAAARRRHRRQLAKERLITWWHGWAGRYLGIDPATFGLRQHRPPRDTSSTEDRPPTAVIFIDEIDALAKCRDGIGRGSFIGGGNDEREQTLNALLTEMDGFGSPRSEQNSGGRSRVNPTSGTDQSVCVIVIAATNRRSVLDPAILRPGRFDRHVVLSYPDQKGREAILQVHARKVKLEGGADRSLLLSQLADEAFTSGFSGADLRNVVNEAALLSVRSGRSCVGWDQLVEAAARVRGMKGM